MRNHRAQTIIEYAVIIGVVATAFVVMQKYLQRGIQQSVKVAADQLGDQTQGVLERETFPGIENYRTSSYTTETSTSNQVLAMSTFDPTAVNDRAHSAVFLARAFNLDTGKYDPNDPSTWAVDYSDVPPGSFGWAEIQALYDAGIATGYGNGTFNPTGTTTRDQSAIMLYRAMGLAPYEGAQIFPDVPDSIDPWQHLLFQATGALYNAGVVHGFPDGKYHPEMATTREDMAVMLTRALGLEPYNGPQVFSDVPPTDPAYGAINSLYKAGITQGVSGPRGSLTRKINETTTTSGQFNNAWYGQKSVLDKDNPDTEK